MEAASRVTRAASSVSSVPREEGPVAIEILGERVTVTREIYTQRVEGGTGSRSTARSAFGSVK